MWQREYKDYPTDSTLKKEQVEPSQGIAGCEMHELMGWGNTVHIPVKKKKRGILADWLIHIFKGDSAS